MDLVGSYFVDFFSTLVDESLQTLIAIAHDHIAATLIIAAIIYYLVKCGINSRASIYRPTMIQDQVQKPVKNMHAYTRQKFHRTSTGVATAMAIPKTRKFTTEASINVASS